MNSINSLVIEGNAVNKAVLKETARGTKLCSFSIASERYFKNGDGMEKEVSYFDIETWGSLAETCEKIDKGRGLRVIGRLKQSRWTGSDGKPCSRIVIIADHVEFKPIFNKAE